MPPERAQLFQVAGHEHESQSRHFLGVRAAGPDPELPLPSLKNTTLCI